MAVVLEFLGSAPVFLFTPVVFLLMMAEKCNKGYTAHD